MVTGTRAEYGLFKSTILKLKKRKRLTVKLLATGMHTLKQYGYTLNEIRKDTHVDCVVPISKQDDMGSALAKEIAGINRYVNSNRIDAILVIGDRDEPFAAATVGIHRNIPVIHVSGGDVSGPTVDHYLRNAITVFSKLHLVQTEQSKQNVIRLGADVRQVRVVGSAGLDGLTPKALMSRSALAKQLKLEAGQSWLLVAQHPTPFDTVPLTRQIGSVLTALSRQAGEKIITYPNADTGSRIFITAIEKLKGKAGFHLFRNLNHKIFLSLQYHCDALIGNSSSGLMEAGFLKTPFVLVGNRQGRREAGKNVIPVNYDPRQIKVGIDRARSAAFCRRLKQSRPVYQGGDVSGNIVRAIEQFLTNH